MFNKTNYAFLLYHNITKKLIEFFYFQVDSCFSAIRKRFHCNLLISKGCSPFVFMNEAAGAPLTGSRCEQIVSDGSSYQSCKKTCAQDVCNVGSVQYAPSCFTCSATG